MGKLTLKISPIDQFVEQGRGHRVGRKRVDAFVISFHLTSTIFARKEIPLKGERANTTPANCKCRASNISLMNYSEYTSTLFEWIDVVRLDKNTLTLT